ncbi:hypothetical protein BJV77DRAFT_966060 [Russula vinacea]|nr:hypothetical protein BJV77DRAFT_966060 [Russula vinacea]
MPRTQQSAMKSTGGVSVKMPPPKARSSRDLRDVEMSPPQLSVPMRRQPDSVATKLANWCYSCMDGGNLLACDLCERVICTMRCLEIPILFEELEKSSSSYRFQGGTCREGGLEVVHSFASWQDWRGGRRDSKWSGETAKGNDSAIRRGWWDDVRRGDRLTVVGSLGARWRGSEIDRESIGGRLKAGDRAITRGWMAGTFPFSDVPSSTVTLYNGLYKGRFTNNLDTNIKAFPNQPTKILGPFFLTYAAAQHNSKSLVILHFTLETINTEGSPANVVHQFLQPFFSSGSLLLEEVKFNIFDEEDADAHADKMEHLAGTISRKHRGAPVWLFITTHGDKDRGDLFYNTKAADFVDTFFDMVLTESIMDVLRTRSTTCFMMVCGGLVTFPESQRDLIKVFNSLLIDMSQRVILESYDISNFIGNLISSSPIIARHTSIIHLCITEKGTSSVQYLWAHKAIQPWGKRLPPQCDKCGSFRSWDKPVHVPASGANRVGYSFRCTGTMPEGVIEVKNGWMTLPWPSTF